MRLIPGLTLATLASITMPACQQNDSEIKESYVVDGQVWADGAVQAALIGPPTVIALVPLATQPSTPENAPAAGGFKLVGVFDSHELNQKQHDIALLDRSPTQSAQILSMTYRLCVSQKPVYGGSDVIISVQKIWDMPSPSDACKSRMTAIGRSFLATGTTVGIVKLEKNITTAEITGGAKTGSWALTLTDLPEVSGRNRIYCPGDSRVSQGSPGQNVSQTVVQGKTSGKVPVGIPPTSQSASQSGTQQGSGTPGQSGGTGQSPTQGGSCGAPIPPADFCNGNPLDAACVNTLLAFPAGTPAQQVTVGSGMKPSESLTNVYQMPTTVGEPGVIKFVSKIAASSEGAGEVRCDRIFSAVARTTHNRVHRHCDLSSSPQPPVDGKLVCGVSVSLRPSSAVLDKVCEIRAIFDSPAPEAVVIRVFAGS
jgi:hypothetical protein